MSKKIHPDDEVKFVSHMHRVLKDGLLGRSENILLGSAPTKRFFSGVLFPDFESFSSQLDDENESDPQPQYRSLAKNFNIGLEFLVRPINGIICLKINSSFKLYPRLFPSFKEQDSFLDFLEVNNGQKRNNLETENRLENNPTNDFLEEIEQRDPEILIQVTESNFEDREESDKGLKLLEKYKAVLVKIDTFEVTINVENALNGNELEVDVQPYIQQAIAEAVEWPDLFSISEKYIEKTGAVPINNRPSDCEIFKKNVEQIKSEKVRFPLWAGKIKVETRPYLDKDGENIFRVAITLVNTTGVPNRELNEKPTGHPLEFFDSCLEVKCLKQLHKSFEFDGAPQDYKYDKTYEVKGINSVGLSLYDGDFINFNTETIPDYFQALYRTKDEELLRAYFEELMDPSKTVKKLTEISLSMRKYLAEWKIFLNGRGDEQQPLRNEREVQQCENEYVEFEAEIDSFDLGIYVLSQNRDKRLMNAFNLMNQVFMDAGKGKYSSWRLFQIIFIVRLLPSLYSREVEETDHKYQEIIASAEIADVLWFPTGGGKTEAYLGLVVTSLFYDRLRGKKCGCSAWIRFPLRMLSKNQLDRLAKILIFAEKVRQTTPECIGKGLPFSIGFFAGSSNTFNFLSAKEKNNLLSSESSRRKAKLLHRCPSCSHQVSIEFDEQRWRILHRCTNKDCFVVRSPILDGVLPIYVTDSEVYRFVPSILCGTVDKLAILGRYREFSHIFGQIGGICSKHGFYSDSCIVGRNDEFNSCKENVASSNKVRTRDAKASFYDPVPTLFIQDELHLLKEELGVLNGHYEGILNEFSRNFGRKVHHLPKVIAATATIESYEHHVKHLYLRRPRKYPSMGYKKGESFYATSTPYIKRRLYMGVLSHSKSQDEVIGRALYLYNMEIQKLYQGSNYLWKKFDFKSIADEEAFLKLLGQYDLSVVYVNQKVMAHDIRRRIIESINSSLSQDTGQTFELFNEILTGETEMEKIVAVIDRIESELKSDSFEQYKSKLHTLIATSLISHGVDLDRINAFFMAGMPSKQAEYIQASSRSARSHAGLVFVSFRPNDLRERSQYQYFIQNHIFMDRLVDPVPINRMSIKAIQRSLPGILSGLLLNLHSQYHDKTIFAGPDYRSYIAKKKVKNGHIQSDIIAQLRRVIIGTDRTAFPLTAVEKAEKFIENYFYELEHILNSTLGKIKDEDVLNPITSFRDIEAGIPLNSDRETSRILGISELF